MLKAYIQDWPEDAPPKIRSKFIGNEYLVTNDDGYTSPGLANLAVSMRIWNVDVSLQKMIRAALVVALRLIGRCELGRRKVVSLL